MDDAVFPMPERDDETGTYRSKYPNESFLDAIRENTGMAGTGEVAKAVGCSHDTAYRRLQSLEEDGEVTSRQIGNTLLWQLVG